MFSANPGPPASWIPARWQGGPLELERRAKAKILPADAGVREAIATWYDPATLSLLEGSPVNCLLVTWSAGADAELERRQQALVRSYTSAAHEKGIAVLGLVYPGSDPSKIAAATVDAGLEGLVLDGDFPAGFLQQTTRALASLESPAVVIPIAREAAAQRTARGPVFAVEGVSPSGRNLADMGIRAGPSSEPWIQSNIWLVRSFRLWPEWRPVWIGYKPEGGTAMDYARSVADAAVAGGRWIVALDDTLCVKLRLKDIAAMGVWRRIGACLNFAEEHAEWRGFNPYGNLGLILDTTGADADVADEYLKLVARRQVPYRLIVRAQLSAASLAGFRTLLATMLAPPTKTERDLLTAFAENGGLVVAGPSFGYPSKHQPYDEIPAGKGRFAVYKDPDPESVARDLKELLSLDEAGMLAFNVPSAITYASGDGKRLLVQLLNYSNSPATAITVRVSGNFKTARLFTPDAEPANLAISPSEGKTDVTIPKLTLWGGVLLE